MRKDQSENRWKCEDFSERKWGRDLPQQDGHCRVLEGPSSNPGKRSEGRIFLNGVVGDKLIIKTEIGLYKTVA